VVPEAEFARGWLRKNKRPDAAGGAELVRQLAGDQEFKRAVLADLGRVASIAGLKGFEKVKDVFLSGEPFSSDNGMLTPTMKAKRNSIQKHFQAQIDDMYSRLD